MTGTSVRAADFYAGKSIELLIGAPPGGGYDIYGRVVARHISRHIPGNPTIVPKNMPGAGSARAAGFIANIAPKDGTVIANIMPGAVIGPVLDPKAKKLFDPTKIMYIGNVNNGVRVCISGKQSKVKTFDDARRLKAKFGGGQKNDSTHDYGYMHRKLTGAKWDLVTGYKGTRDLTIALERGEIDGFCGFDWASLKAQKPAWVRDKTVNVLIQDAIESLDELNKLGVPHIMKYVKDDTTRKVVELILSQQVFHRSFIAPPGTTPANLATLRKAFDETMKDPQFLAEANKLRIDVAPLTGAKVQQVVANLYASPHDVVELARQAINP
ncbi:MAG: Bug family tripartite tricarboxylate transporter substrate binding protein [Xanthobacteraceae bacterium]